MILTIEQLQFKNSPYKDNDVDRTVEIEIRKRMKQELINEIEKMDPDDLIGVVQEDEMVKLHRLMVIFRDDDNDDDDFE